MRNTLLIRVGLEPGAGCQWLPLDNSGVPTSVVRSGTLEQAAVEGTGLRIVALVPGIDCLLTTVKIPGRSNRQKLLRAIPYSLEEQLSDEVEDLHFAVGKATAGGEYPVAVIAAHRMDAYLEAFRAVGMEVIRMVPDLLATPWSENQTSIVVDGAVALVRTGPSGGYAVDAENLALFFDTAPMDTDTTDESEAEATRVRIYIPAGGTPPELPVANVEVEQYNGDALALLAGGLDTGSIDLLQGAYSRTQEWGRVWRPWRATAALLVAGFLLSHVAMGIDYYRLGKESGSLSTRIEEIYRQTFPGTKRVVNPRVQMEQQLEELQRRQGAGSQFLVLLARSGDVLRNAKEIEITGASYRAGRLDVELNAASLQVLEDLKQTLSGKGLKVEIQSATTEADQRVKSRLRIQGKTA
jgi:general secretion pathway protein L